MTYLLLQLKREQGFFEISLPSRKKEHLQVLVLDVAEAKETVVSSLEKKTRIQSQGETHWLMMFVLKLK